MRGRSKPDLKYSWAHAAVRGLALSAEAEVGRAGGWLLANNRLRVLQSYDTALDITDHYRWVRLAMGWGEFNEWNTN